MLDSQRPADLHACALLPAVLSALIVAKIPFTFVAQEHRTEFLAQWNCVAVELWPDTEALAQSAVTVAHVANCYITILLEHTRGGRCVQPDHIVYRVTTSGSTGAPKEVLVPLGCVHANVRDLCSRLQLGAADRLAWTTPLTFDPSMVELMCALHCGATLLVPSVALRQRPMWCWSVRLRQANVTVLQCTPSELLRCPVDVLRTELLSSTTTLRHLLLGGEPFPAMHRLRQLRCDNCPTFVWNLYGVTEVSCWATIALKYASDIAYDGEGEDESYLGEAMLVRGNL